MSKELVTKQYHTVTRVNAAVIDGELQSQFLVKLETWSTVYGDCLVDSEMLMSGTAQEVETFLSENNIQEVITVGIGS